MRKEDRQYDVVVWGASGFTGRLVVEYLLEHYPSGDQLRWAVAGRNKAKLEQLFDSLDQGISRPAIIIADSHDRDSLDGIAKSTRVVLTTVGPYAKYGAELVEACVNNGTHYCDLCGEVQWMRQMIDKHQLAAEQSGARIVMSCGFDSIPSDFGVWFLQQQAIEKFDAACSEITLLVRAMKGGASGGTYASMLTAIEQARQDRNIARILTDPYALNPDGARQGPDGRDQRGPAYNDDAKVWTAPFVMAGVNTKVVRRSHALAGYPYGRDFRYDESVMTGRGFSGWLKGTIMTVGLGAIVFFASFTPTRKLLQKFFLAKPGEGPDENMQKTGFFNLLQIGKLADGTVVRAKITGDQDPGYGSTRKMLSECAVCLAKDELEAGGGVLTPASAMARPLLKRLRDNAGLTFELRD